MFFKEKGIGIDETNYGKLFYGEKQFVKQYGVTKQEILSKYNYAEFTGDQIRKKSVQELGVETRDEQGDVGLLDTIEGQVTKEEKDLAQQEKDNGDG